MITPTYTRELELLNIYRLIAGIDEVGRAPLAGPVVSAVVILDPEKIGRYRSKTKWWQGVRDSKTLSPRRRGSIAEFIKDNALDFAIGLATHEEIDELNIHHATLISMKRAIENLKVMPEMALIDGRFKIHDLEFMNQETIIHGDAHVLSIAAASILAKVYRDDLMKKYSIRYDAYGFEKHKGYPTEFHQRKLLLYGPCEIHRMTFTPVKQAITKRFQEMIK